MIRFPSLRRVGREAARTLRRFPLVLLSALTAATAALLLVDGGSSERLERLLATALLGLPLFLALALLAERRSGSAGVRLALQGGGALALVAFFLAWPGWSDRVAWARFVHLAVAFHLLVAFLPYLRRGERNGFWQYNRILLLRFLFAAVHSAVLFAGLAVALAAVDNLLGVPVADETYARLWVLVALVFHTWFFLAGVPPDLAALERRSDHPRGLEAFSQFLLVPIVALYVAILTAYAARILVTQAWPSGWIGYLVSSLAALGILSVLLVHPLRDEPGKRWIGLYSRWLYVALLPAAVLLLMALWKRIDQYGVTENRYFLAALGLWLAGLGAAFGSTGSRAIKAIPASLCVLALVTFLGPWSAYAVSEASQAGRLEGLLRRHAILVDGGLRSAEAEVPAEDRREIGATLRYLIETHGTGSIAGWFGDSLARVDTMAAGTRPAEGRWEARRRAALVMERLGLEYVDERGPPGPGERFALHSAPPSGVGASAPIPLAGHDWLIRFLSLPDSFVVGERPLRLAYDAERGSLGLSDETGRRVAEAPLLPLVDSARARAGPVPDAAHLPAEALRVALEGEGAAVTVYFDHLVGRRIAPGAGGADAGGPARLEVESAAGWILLRLVGPTADGPGP